MSKLLQEGALPHFGMREPAQWPGLLERTAELLKDPALDDECRVRELVLVALDGMDYNTVDHNRYYGLGVGMCHLGKLLKDPAERTAVINSRAGSIALHHRTYCDGFFYTGKDVQGVHIGELDRSSIGLIQPEARKATAQLPDDIRFLTGVLSYIKSFRSQLSDKDNYPGLAENIGFNVRDVVEGKQVARSLSQDFAAAARIFVRTLRLHHNGSQIPPLYNLAASDPLVFEVMTPEELLALDLLAFSAKTGALRLDEFQAFNFLGVGEDGQMLDDKGCLRFDYSKIPATPGPLDPKSLVRHTDRIRCPGLYVAGLFKTILGIIPEIAIEAEAKIRSRKGPYSWI